MKQKYTETSPNAVRAAVKSVFGLDCDKDDIYQNLKFRSLASHAADCDVLAVMPHNGLQDTSFARGFNLQGGFLANVPIPTEMRTEDHYYARVVVTKTEKGLEVMFLVSTERAYGASLMLHDFLTKDLPDVVPRGSTTLLAMSTVALAKVRPGTMTLAKRGDGGVFLHDLSTVFQEQGRFPRTYSRTPSEKATRAAEAAIDRLNRRLAPRRHGRRVLPSKNFRLFKGPFQVRSLVYPMYYTLLYTIV